MPKSVKDYLPTEFWLMKSEPDAFSIDDLIRMKSEHWDGVRNYQARNLMRDQMKVGHRVLFYHSSTAVPGVVGTATVVKEAIPDHTAWDRKSKYFDAKSDPENPTWWMVTLGKAKKFKNIVTLADIKEHPRLREMLVAQKGQRLSIQPVLADDFSEIVSLGR